MNFSTILLQIPSSTSESDTFDISSMVNMDGPTTIIDLALSGGWLMIVLVLLFLVATYVFIQRQLVIKSAGKLSSTFMSRIKDYIHEGKIESAINLCKTTNTPAARIVAKGVARLGRPESEIIASMESVTRLETSKLKKGLPILSTVMIGAPMIGLLGTAIGLISTFREKAQTGLDMDITALSGGALVTTVVGLLVGVLALFAYNNLKAKANGVEAKLESVSISFMDILNEPIG